MITTSDPVVPFLQVICLLLILFDLVLYAFTRYLEKRIDELYLTYDLIVRDRGLKNDDVQKFIEEKRKKYE